MKSLILLLFIFFLAVYSASAISADIQGIPITITNQHALELIQQAQRLIDVGRPLEARPFLEQSLQLDSHCSYGYVLLANVGFSSFSAGYNLASNTGVSMNEFKQNLDRARNVEGKTEGEKLLIEINQTFINNDATKRIELAKTLVAKYPQSPRAWLTLGFMQGTINQLKESRQSMLKALELDPRFVGAHYGIAFSYLFTEPRDFQQAEKHFQQCIKWEPSEAKGYEGLGDADRAMNQLQKAWDAYNKALEIDPKLSTGNVKKGHVDSFLGRFDQARTDYDHAILQETDPVNKVFDANLRAFVHVHSGEPKAALDELQQLVDSMEKRGLSPDQIDTLKQATLTNEMTIALHSNLLSAAENVLVQLKDVNVRINERVNDPNLTRQANAGIVLWESQLAAMKKDFATAHAKAEENRKLLEADQNPRKLEEYYAHLGFISLQQKNYREAVENYLKADTANISVKYHLGLAYTGIGQTVKAKKLFEDVAHYNFNTVEFALLRKDAIKHSL